MELKEFTGRVYGRLVREGSEVLISDEKQENYRFTKFPGGGLELGEGVIDCLKREFMEELNQPIEVVRLLHVVEEAVQSKFRPWQQVISIYYQVICSGDYKFRTDLTRDDLEHKDQYEVFSWQSIETLNPNQLTFIADKEIVDVLKKAFTHD
jgi:ADP-ribose pyrophosphatase YjhB (NUDIX family)